ncbi:MAG: PTS sugar transporter subunit IIA [Phycisphaerales bacterium]|nr:PTS sugar transporter subunit IIA [Phycisphaerales bacterium]
MKLRDIVDENAIIPSLDAETRDEAITELVDALVESGSVSGSYRDEFIKEVIKREKKGSTGFGHGVAVPHVKHAAIEKMVVAIGVSHTGIEFNALDRAPVYSLFLVLSPVDRPEDHLDAMEAIFGNLNQETFRRFMRQATEVEHIVTLLDEADARASIR